MHREIQRRSLIKALGASGLTLAGVQTATATPGENNQEPDSSTPPEDTTHSNVEPTVADPSGLEPNEAASTLLIKDCNPWDTTANENVLTAMGESYDLINSDQLADIDLGLYDVLIVPSTQSDSYYNNVVNNESSIKSFVEAGGVLVGHVAQVGWPCSGTWGDSFLPNEVEYTQSHQDDLTINASDHPVVADVNNTLLDGWSDSAHGTLSGFPNNATVVVESSGGPVYLEYSHGSGTVLTTSQTIEFPWADIYDGPDRTAAKSVLKNELDYAINGAGQNVETLLKETFENTAVGNYPSDWVKNGNENQKVSDTAHGGDKSLVTIGSPGGCWEAIANHSLKFPNSGTVRFQGAIGPTSNGSEGCHNHRGRVALRTQASGWGEGNQLPLFEFTVDGGINAPGGTKLGGYNVDTWNTFDIEYTRSNGDVTITYTFNGEPRGSISRSVADYEDNLQYLALSSGEFEIYWDALLVTAPTGDSGPGPVGGFDQAPKDPDGDGLYEDINGDGTADIVDVQAYLQNLEGKTINNNPGAFDFNDDGTIDIVDVQKLLNEI